MFFRHFSEFPGFPFLDHRSFSDPRHRNLDSRIFTVQKWTLFGPFFDHFLGYFVNFGYFTHFRVFWHNSELSGPRVPGSSGTPDVSKWLKTGKYGYFTRPKGVPRGVQKRRKSGHTEDWSGDLLTRNWEKDKKSRSFMRTVKKCYFSTFSRFLVPRQKCQNGPGKRVKSDNCVQNEQNKHCF